MILTKKNDVRGFSLPTFKTYYKSIVNNTVQHWWKCRIEFRNNLHVPSQLYFTKAAKAIERGLSLSTNVSSRPENTKQNNKKENYFTQYTKISLR